LVPENAVNTVGEWQLSHAVLAVGIWLEGGSFGTMLAKLKPVPWHWMQLLAMPAWFIVYTA
jgi:hypothetical protein